jgi:pimeloyl-ACP methyl ester carboxylesterase
MLATPELPTRSIPEPGHNNVWYRCGDSDAVLVFVHGILSCSRTSWLNSSMLMKPSYWPQIVAEDERFDGLGIFLGGYYTDFDSGNYGIRDCVEELLSGLKQKHAGCKAPIEQSTIIFVCHSLGGVVVRGLLERYKHIFKDKDVALVLIASPSYGVHGVDTLSLLINLSANAQALALKWNSEIIGDWDDRFKDLRESGFIRKLRGIEFYENKFIVKWKYFLPYFGKYLVVSRESAGRYFGAPKQIPRSDHYSICKPKSKNDIVHQYLHDFLFEEAFIPVKRYVQA